MHFLHRFDQRWEINMSFYEAYNLSMTRFVLPMESGCYSNYLLLTSSQLSRKYCGHRLPWSQTIRGLYIKIHFQYNLRLI